MRQSAQELHKSVQDESRTTAGLVGAGRPFTSVRRDRCDRQDVQSNARRDAPVGRVGPTRREWLAAVPGALGLATAAPMLAMTGSRAAAEPVSTMPGSMSATIDPYPASTGQSAREDVKKEPHLEFPSHDPDVVREVVAVSHVNIDRLRELIEASPALAKSAWDWGFGDWESALGAASHMGRPDIAELLIRHGARPDLFTFAMLGHVEIVRAYVKAVPGIQRIAGPHGITLLQHARTAQRAKRNTDAGRDAARKTAEYLESLGDADVRATSLELSDEQKRIYVGRYAFGKGDNDVLEVLTNRRGMLAVKRGARFARTLHRVEEHGFAPAGAAAVRVRFGVDDGRAVSLTVHDPTPLIIARRVD